MLNMIFRRADGRDCNVGWVTFMYYVTMEGIVLNWEDIIANSLSSYIATPHEILNQIKFELYMGSFFIDIILIFHPFEKLKCSWSEEKAPIYAS